MKLLYPVTIVNITQGFGENPEYYSDESQHPGWRWPGHNGLDFGGALFGAPGDPILAAAPGDVSRISFEEGGYGLYIRLIHLDGSQTYYAHLSQVNVRLNQHLAAGERLGLMGSSGCADGVHLHFGYRLSSGGPAGYAGYIDPAPYFQSPLPFSEGLGVGEGPGVGVSLTSTGSVNEISPTEPLPEPVPELVEGVEGVEGEPLPEPVEGEPAPERVEGVEASEASPACENAGRSGLRTAPTPADGVSFPAQGRVRVVVDVLNIRSRPGLDAVIIGALYAGAEVAYDAVVTQEDCTWLAFGGLYAAAVYQGAPYVTVL